jgi:hypothetical protein
MARQMTPLLAKAVEVRFCVRYLRDNVTPTNDTTRNISNQCVVAAHLQECGVSPVAIRLLLPDAAALGY